MKSWIVFLLLALLVAAGLILVIPQKTTTPPENTEVLASNLEIPWSLEFAPDNRLFFTERVGRVNVLENGAVYTLLTLYQDNIPPGEGGLLGLALDQDFGETRFVFIYYTYYDGTGQLWNRVSRFRENDGELVDETVIFDNIPGHSNHNGGRIKFGPDGKLYVTTGDAGQSSLAQDKNSLAGKILRMNADGTVPSDNPFQDSAVYSIGHRNPQGLAWHPASGILYATEYGPSAHDEINLIEAGKNYGWPVVTGSGTDNAYVNPIHHTGDDTWAPSGATLYTGTRYPGWEHNLFVATLRGTHLRVVTLAAPENVTVESTASLFEGSFGRLRDVVQGPDGHLYLATCNRDGRGSPAATDDRIIKIKSLPEKE